MAGGWLVLVESNTTGSGRQFCEAAREIGLRPVVLVADPDRYPYLRETGIEYRVTDTRDPEAVLDVCRQLPGPPIAGVTSSSEYFIATAAGIAARLELQAPAAAAIAACRDKARQRELLAGAHVAVPDHVAVTTAGQAVAAARELGPPVVVKPASGSGSVGVRLCATLAEVADAAAGVLMAGVNERGMCVAARALVEQYVSGDEYSVETFGGQVIGVTRKHLGPAPFFVEIGHDFPAPLPQTRRRALADATGSALAALGLGWGAAHTELRWGPDGPAVIEVNPRLAGGMIPALVCEATGIDLVGCCVALAAGHPVPLTGTRTGGAAIRFVVAERSGRVAAIAGADRAARMPGIKAVTLAVAEGDEVPAVSNSFQDRLGYVLAGGADVTEAVDRAEAALATVSVRIDARA
jgi:argininosuccinate lyase